MNTTEADKSVPFTRDLLRKHLRERWAERGITLGENERMGVSASEFADLSMARNKSLEMPYLDLWIEILDEIQSWNISLFTVMGELRKKSPALTSFERSVIVILAKVIADTFAIRHLVVLGFDIQANILLRSTGEYLDLFVALLFEPKLSEEFVKTDVPEEARKFWHRHTARGSVRAKVITAWQKFFGGNDGQIAAEMADWGRGYNDILSALSHPSFAGGFLTAIPFKEKYTKENWMGVWGDKSNGSVQTITILLAYMFPILLITRGFPFEGYSSFFSVPLEYDDTSEIHRHVDIGRDILASLIMSLHHEPNSAFVFPKHDMSIFKESGASEND